MRIGLYSKSELDGLAISKAFKFIAAIKDVLDPVGVVEIPLDGFAEAGSVVLLGRPAEFVFDLGGIDRVAQVVPGAVGDEGDLFRVGFTVLAGAQFVE